MDRQKTLDLLAEYINSPSLKNHSLMVGAAMEAYAKNFGLTNEEIDIWWIAGVLHDLDWQNYPDEHPNKAANEILPEAGYSSEIIEAIKAHAPDRTGKHPETQMEKYLFACDEICGFLNASALVRPTGFSGMDWKSVKKKLKTDRFAAGVNREDVYNGAELIETDLGEHVTFLTEVFQDWEPVR